MGLIRVAGSERGLDLRRAARERRAGAREADDARKELRPEPDVLVERALEVARADTERGREGSHGAAPAARDDLPDGGLDEYDRLGKAPIPREQSALDHGHYVEKVVRPVAESILEAVGGSFDEAMGAPQQMRLL